MRKRFKGVIALVLIVTLQLSIPLKASAQDTYFNDDEIYTYIKTMVDMIKTKYQGEFDDKTVLEGMLKGLFNNFDPYTTYFTNEEAESFLNTMSGQVLGIGIQVSQYSNNIIIDKVLPKSPAESAGIIDGDIILAVDGKDVAGLSYTEVSGMIRGEKDTKVKVSVNRNGTSKDFDITRDVVTVPSGIYRYEDGIGYIKLDSFDYNSAQFIAEALAYMDSKGTNKIVLDLRDNPGGAVSEAVQIASNFVPKGVITTLDYKDPSAIDFVYTSPLEKTKYKLVILVNENSASASEILTGAVQDTKAGTIIGTKTFGKAKVQNLIPLLTPDAYEKYKAKLGVGVIDAMELERKYGIEPLESEIQGMSKITTAMYKTPNGRMIDLQGIEPDIFIKDSTYDAPFDINTLSPLAIEVNADGSIPENHIVEVKKILLLAGYEINDFSNTWDNDTASKLLKFQKDRGLEAKGILDSSTLNALNNVLHLTNLLVNKSYYTAVDELNK